MISLTITIPGTPSVALSPNARAHWGKRSAVVRESKSDAYIATMGCLYGDGAKRWDFSSTDSLWIVEVVIYWEKGRKTMDSDNAVAICKSLLDGVADALGVNDKRFRIQPVEQRRSGDRAGYVVVTVTEVEV